LVDAVEKAKAAGGALHIMGLLSEGGVHSHEDHIVAMAELALKRGATVYLHAFLDGRDTPPRSAQPSLEKLDALFAQYPNQGRMLITADHGNVEQMQDYHSGQVHTQHTTELVPFIYVGPTQATIADGGVLADVAPTLLSLMHLPVPADMQGRNLITLDV
jgi:bisphosphoglycerate-independent phosphoglycerate mutase (AlkP superfamily)